MGRIRSRPSVASLAWRPKRPTTGASRAGLVAHAENRGGQLSWHKGGAASGRSGERQRRGKMTDSPIGKLYMDALENMWAKKKESEDLKEKNVMIIFLH
jgi:hypothetical protein